LDDDRRHPPDGAIYEDKFARVYAEIVRIDQLRAAVIAADKDLAEERTRRLDQRMDAQETAVAAALAAAEKAVTAALTAADKAVGKAELAQAKVNETQNEFRGTLRDQATAFMPRSETENLVRELRGLITTNATQFTELRSRVDVGPPTLHQLQARSDEGVGRKLGTTEARALTFAVVAAVVGIVGIVLAIVK
jgi:preprotein translocase subunit SecF